MKKIITIILLSSVLFLPNHNVEAAHNQNEYVFYKIEKVAYGDNYSNHYHFGNNSWYYNSPNWVNHKHQKNYKVKKYGSKSNHPWKNNKNSEIEVEVESKPEDNKEEQPKLEQPSINNPTVEEDKPANSTEQSSPILSTFEQEVLDLTNAERNKMGLQALELDVNLTKSAQEKSKDMAVNHYFSHTSPTYGSPFDLMKTYGVTYRSAAENIARGQRTAEEVVRGWMNSPGHKENILTSNFTHIGIGHDPNGHYWTQQFIQK